MSAYMVQENHWKKLNTILYQYAISLFFSWILLDHPVYLIENRQDPGGSVNILQWKTIYDKVSDGVMI